MQVAFIQLLESCEWKPKLSRISGNGGSAAGETVTCAEQDYILWYTP